MTRKEYMRYRRLIRDNGFLSAMRWIYNPVHRMQMLTLSTQLPDILCKREDVRLRYPHRSGGVAMVLHPLLEHAAYNRVCDRLPDIDKVYVRMLSIRGH